MDRCERQSADGGGAGVPCDLHDRGIWLVVDVVFARATAIVCAAIVGSMFVALWYAVPLHRRGAKKG